MSSSQTHSAQTGQPWLRRFVYLLALATLFLIFMGGQVKSHEAGLAVPDWPTTYGENMFTFHPSKWVGGIWHEHTHRLVASTIGFMTVILVVWLFLKESRKWVRTLGYFALGAVIVQGLLGGLTVYLLLPAWVSISHGILAQTFFLMVLLLAYAQTDEWFTRQQHKEREQSSPVGIAAFVMLAVVFFQLILGALLRHTESGLALPDFPTMAGQWIPIFTQDSVNWVNDWRQDYTFDSWEVLPAVSVSQLWIHFVHRLGAVVVSVSLIWLVVRVFKQKEQFPAVWKMTIGLCGLVVIQIALGIVTVLSHRVPLITSFHVVTGAATLGTCWLLALRAWPVTLWDESTEPDEKIGASASTSETVSEAFTK
jgi:cytochrome c oxidase assembly protein subunit 15